MRQNNFQKVQHDVKWVEKCIYLGKDRIIKTIYWKKSHLCNTYAKTPLCMRNDHLGNQLRSAALINDRRLCPGEKDDHRFGGERHLSGRIHLWYRGTMRGIILSNTPTCLLCYKCPQHCSNPYADNALKARLYIVPAG